MSLPRPRAGAGAGADHRSAIYTNLVASNSEERQREMGILNEDGSVKKEWFISTNEGCRALITAAFDPELPKEKNGAYLNSRAWIAPEDQKPPNGIAAHAIGEVRVRDVKTRLTTGSRGQAVVSV